MKDRDLEALIRMAFEAERLDPVPTPQVVFRRPAGTYRISPIAIGFAAALLVLMSYRGSPAPRPVEVTHGSAVSPTVSARDVTVCHLPAMDDGPTRVETFEPRVSEPATLLAILRTWSADCDCLSWQIHEWRDGSLMHDVIPGEPVSIEVASADQPSIQQVLLLAVATDRSALTRIASNDASELLDCLNSRPFAAGENLEPGAYARSVATCLPPEILVIPQTYVARN